tara:strand:+ start:201 stop:305 length:105 start_codon:yes stop_codon:yes gene_type:complete
MTMIESINIPGILAVTIFFLTVGAVLIKTGVNDE